jgi:DNA ligase-associated metallophosphoesterase
MTFAPIPLARMMITPDASGAGFLAEHATLIVADLHFEKGSAFLTKGVPLPPFDTAATLARLEEVCARLGPRRVIALGDSFHDRGADQRLGPQEFDRLSRLIEAHDWHWIMGNHDPAPPESLGGQVADEIKIDQLVLRHEPKPGAVYEIAGHLHPVAKIAARGRRLRRRCFVSDGTRLILPAFGAYAGGLNVLDQAFVPLLHPAFHAWMIGSDDIYKIAAERLVPDTFG